MLISGGDLQRARNAMTWIEEFHPIPILEATGLIEGATETTLAPLLARHDLDTRADRHRRVLLHPGQADRPLAARAWSSTTATR